MAAESEFNIYQHFPSAVSCFSRVFTEAAICSPVSSRLVQTRSGQSIYKFPAEPLTRPAYGEFCKHFKQITEIKDILGNYISLMESTNILSLDTFVDMYQSF